MVKITLTAGLPGTNKVDARFVSSLAPGSLYDGSTGSGRGLRHANEYINRMVGNDFLTRASIFRLKNMTAIKKALSAILANSRIHFLVCVLRFISKLHDIY